MDVRKFLDEMLKPGTRQAALLWGIIGLVVAILLLTIGFFKTLLLVACCAIGVFIGLVPDKRAFFARVARAFRGDNAPNT